MSIRANFAGTCADCGDRYPEGPPIQLVEDYGWCHEKCPDPTNVTGRIAADAANICNHIKEI